MNRVLSSIDGRIVEIKVDVGDKIDEGDVLFVIEAMKVEIEIESNVKGRVGQIYVGLGDFVSQNDLLLIIGDDETIGISFNESLINELVRVILSKDMFYILCDDDYRELTQAFENNLKANGMNTLFLSENMDYVFKNGFQDNANLLIISKSGQNDEIWDFVKTARLNKVKVYGICGDFRHGLAMLCDKTMVFSDYFDACLEEIFSIIHQRILENSSKNKVIPKPRPIGNVIAQFKGTVLKVNVNVGDEVKKGDIILVMEAMKMENEILAEMDGVIDKIYIMPGDYIDQDDVIMNMVEKY